MTRFSKASIAIVAICAASSAACGQGFKNYGFNKLTTDEWTIVNTAGGVGAPAVPVFVDIDGAGPLLESQAIAFRAGRAAGSGAPEGVEGTQNFALDDGVPFTIGFNWGAYNGSNGVITEGGVFSIIQDGVILASQSAGSMAAGALVYGSTTATVTGDGLNHDWGFRITRPDIFDNNMWQGVDDFAPQARQAITIVIQGNCPGAITLSWLGVTPGATLYIFHSNATGLGTISAGPLKGIRLGLSSPLFFGTVTDSGNGAGSANGIVNTAACGRFVQIVDEETCETSNTDQIN
jgi:hypothetical protein